MQAKQLILNGPDSTRVESEVQMYLLALKNSMLPEAIPTFTKYAESEVGAFSTIALAALQRYHVSLLTDEVKPQSRPASGDALPHPRGSQRKRCFVGETHSQPGLPPEQKNLREKRESRRR